MSRSDDLTNASLAKLEKRLKKEYQKASEELKERYDEYINGSQEIKKGGMKIPSLADRIAQEEKAYKAGAYTDKEFEAWKLTQIQRGERYEAMIDDMTKRITATNQIASAYINDSTPSIYSLNQNYQAYEIGKGKQGISFTMYDEQTVKNLVTDNGNYTEFRTVSVDPVRDYSWNSKKIQSALTSGILQGKPIDQIAHDFLAVMKTNENSAIRNARTAYTSAQNGGRLESLRQAEKQGIKVQKQWLSAHDGRVRDSHAVLNGQIRDIDKRFDNGLMFPADSEGRPAEIYNCRCTLTYIYPEWDEDVSSEIYADEKLANETYSQFVKRMRSENPDQIIENRKRYEKGIDTKTNTTSKKSSVQNNFNSDSLFREEVKKRFKGTTFENWKVKNNQTSIKVDAESVNPNYSNGGRWRTNCGSCSGTYELRRRGLDVEAIELNGMYCVEYDQLFDNAQKVQFTSKRSAKLVDELKTVALGYGEGARGGIYLGWKNSSYNGHFMNFEVENGEVKIICPQSSKIGKEAEEYFLSASPSKSYFMRWDNCNTADRTTKYTKEVN